MATYSYTTARQQPLDGAAQATRTMPAGTTTMLGGPMSTAVQQATRVANGPQTATTATVPAAGSTPQRPQILPTASGTQTAASATAVPQPQPVAGDTRANVNTYTPVQGPQGIGMAQLGALGNTVAQNAQGLSNLPDRFQLAQQQFGTFADSTQPYFTAALREATQRAAAQGRLGSGMLTTDYGNLADKRALDLQAERDRLFQGALEGTIGDRFNTVGAQSGVLGNLFSQGLAGAQFQSGQQQTALGQLNRNQEFQNTLAQQGIGNAAAQYQLEQQAQNQAFQQDQARMALLASLGYQSPNTGALLAGAGQYGQQAAGSFDAVGNLLAAYGYRQGNGG